MTKFAHLFKKNKKYFTQPNRSPEKDLLITQLLPLEAHMDQLDLIEPLHQADVDFRKNLGIVPPQRNKAYAELITVAKHELECQKFYDAADAFLTILYLNLYDIAPWLGLSACFEGLEDIRHSAILSFYALILNPDNARAYKRHGKLLGLLGKKEAAHLFTVHGLRLELREQQTGQP